MSGSSFPFIRKDILRQNLDEAFNHVVTLLPFTESSTYNEAAKSAFRKTIIIYMASIIEALLFSVLDNNFTDEEVAEHYSAWELKDKNVLYVVDEKHEIVAGTYKKINSKTGKDKMNLGHVNKFLKTKNIISKSLHDKIDEVRELRNDQHIGNHKKVKSYSKNDLEKAFSVAKDVKEFVKNNS